MKIKFLNIYFFKNKFSVKKNKKTKKKIKKYCQNLNRHHHNTKPHKFLDFDTNLVILGHSRNHRLNPCEFYFSS